MISIIIPSYNEEKYINKLLTELRSLSLPHEIIVSDDKSTDDTVRIAQQFTPHVLVPHYKHATIAANRNKGAAKAKGDLLVFFDADVSLVNADQFFNTALSYFKNDATLVALTSFIKVEKTNETFFDAVIYTLTNYVHVIKNNILQIGEASGKFQMIRRDAFLKVHGFREDLVTREDADMFQRVTQIGKVFCTTELTVFHSGRRAHAIGWPKLLYLWGINSLWFFVSGKSLSKSWEKAE